jgi:uncharacterized protein YecT (DUF1311 family)
MTLLHRRSRVIDQEGRELDERPSGLRAMLAVVFHRPDTEEDERPTAEIPVYRRTNTGPDDLAGVSRMPFTILSLRAWVRFRFEEVERDWRSMMNVMSGGCARMMADNNRRMNALDQRLARLAERQRAWIALENGRVAAGAMAAMYAAGGTELVQALTPAVLARMDEQRKQRLALGGAL